MKICQLSTYGQQCGIAEYADQLHKAFLDLGHDSRVLANIPYEALTFNEDASRVRRVFHVEIRDKKTDFDFEKALGFLVDEMDILLVQYESCLYPRHQLHQFLRLARERYPRMRIAVVFHSSCIWPDFQWNLINWGVAHEENVLGCIPTLNKCIIRHGLPDWGDDVSPVEARKKLGFLNTDRFTVGSCGFGRVRFEQTIPAVVGLGWNYLISSQERERVRIDPIISALPEWQKQLVVPIYNYCPYDQLADRLQACEMVLLDYPSTTACVTSGAARLAIGAHRKLVVSATNWFSDVPAFVYKIAPDCPMERLREQLKLAVDELSGDGAIISRRIASQQSYVKAYSWKNTCESAYIPLFQKLLS